MFIKRVIGILILLFVAITILTGIMIYRTEAAIDSFVIEVEAIGKSHPAQAHLGKSFDNLPKPVQRYFAFVFKEGVPHYSHVQLKMEGQFRRPQTTSFSATTARQTIAIGEPALMFCASTSIIPGVWARAYDFYANGKMEMKAKILSTITVVDEKETPNLNRISLRRWLMESPLYPMALLPGGKVHWEEVDDYHARAIVTDHGVSTDLLATFADDGRLLQFDAEEDGDLTTPYHGSGEHAQRTDYRLISGVMIPHGFLIARAARNKLYPFWRGKITDIRFMPATSVDTPVHQP